MKNETNQDGHGGIGNADLEPWPEAVEGAALLEELTGTLRRFVVLPQWAAETLALWTLHTYAFPLREVSAYIGLESPEKRCGKTTLLMVLSELVNRPIVAANISPSAFFRVIEETQPTLLIDEADTFLQGNDELRGILNAGYTRKTAYVVRVANQILNADGRYSRADQDRAGGDLLPGSPDGNPSAGKMWRRHPACDPLLPGSPGGSGSAGSFPRGSKSIPGPRAQSIGSRLARFSCWCPKIMAAIGRLPDTLADRCIVIRMQRKTAGEPCERLRNLQGLPLRRRCARFVRDHQEAIPIAQPEIPPRLNDRAGDIWEPLLVLADLAGGPWPELARQAALGLTAGLQEKSLVGALLLDLLCLFGTLSADRIFSRDLVAHLNTLTDRPWMEMRRGKAITELWLAQQLRPYGIRSRTMWMGTESAKGYFQEDFGDVFQRYISRSDVDLLRRDSAAAATAATA